MDRHSIRRGLIGTFLEALHKKNSGDTISLLAMIGIETVLQHLHNDDEEAEMMHQIEGIKRQLQDVQMNQIKAYHSPPHTNKTASRVAQPAKNTQNKVGTVNRRKSNRDVTPTNKPSQRHHLDDNQMKQALIWQQAKQSPLPPSVHYFLDFKDLKPANKRNPQVENVQVRQKTAHSVENHDYIPPQEDSSRQIYNYNNYERAYRRLETFAQNQPQQQPQPSNVQNNYIVPKYQPHENEINGINPESAHFQAVNFQPTSNIQNSYLQNSNFQNTNFYPVKRAAWKSNMVVSQSCLPDVLERQNHSPHFNSNNMLKSESCNVLAQAKQRHSSSHDMIVHSPIIDSSSYEKYMQQQYSQQSNESDEQNVHISRFDPKSPGLQQTPEYDGYDGLDNSQLSVNSSAFSLFTPNEEIRTFFHKEFQKQDIPLRERVNQADTASLAVKESLVVNKNQASSKASNVFVKGRMGGSKIF